MITISDIIETIESARALLYEVENLNDRLMEDDPSLAENEETFKNFHTFLNGLKTELAIALTIYDDLNPNV